MTKQLDSNVFVVMFCIAPANTMGQGNASVILEGIGMKGHRDIGAVTGVMGIMFTGRMTI